MGIAYNEHYRRLCDHLLPRVGARLRGGRMTAPRLRSSSDRADSWVTD